jgi:hypothetical protein
MKFENDKSPEEIRADLQDALSANDGSKIVRFVIAVASGLIPWVGGAVGGVGGLWSEAEGDHFKKVLAAWLKLQEEEMAEIGRTLIEVMQRLDLNDEKIRARVQSPAYLSIVKKCTRDWSAAESEERRRLIRNLLVNAASAKITDDDVVRLFVEWIEKYSETHFKVIRETYRRPFVTRAGIWNAIGAIRVREDSAEADLFKTVIHDLSVGHIIRQERPKDYNGNFLKSTQRKSANRVTTTSAFDDEKPYLLTNLGRQFVHYTMNEVTTKITGNA